MTSRPPAPDHNRRIRPRARRRSPHFPRGTRIAISILEPGDCGRSPEELQARYQALTRELAEIDAVDDTPDEVYDEFMRGIDEERRRQGRPPAFEGCY